MTLNITQGKTITETDCWYLALQLRVYKLYSF